MRLSSEIKRNLKIYQKQYTYDETPGRFKLVGKYVFAQAFVIEVEGIILTACEGKKKTKLKTKKQKIQILLNCSSLKVCILKVKMSFTIKNKFFFSVRFSSYFIFGR